MKVFISWSGDRSRAIAEILRQWLPAVIQAVRPYYSPDDIAKGTRWSGEIAKELEASRVGLICLTRDNLQAPWIMFEAGALSKSMDRSRVVPLLFGIEPSDVSGPLVQFQACVFSQQEMERVVRMINTELGDAALAADVLDNVFEKWWPELEQKIADELAKADPRTPAVRPEREILEEVLALTRSMSRAPREHISRAALHDLFESYALLMDAVDRNGAPDELRRAVHSLSRPLDYLTRSAAPVRSSTIDRFRDAALRARLASDRRPAAVSPSEIPAADEASDTSSS